MKKRFLLEKLSTKQGESAIFIILLVANIIVFVLIPIIGITFEKSIQRIAFQEIGDTLELSVYDTYHHLNLEQLSQGDIKTEEDLLIHLNRKMENTFHHPQVKSVYIKDLLIEKDSLFELTCTIELNMEPTLYRQYLSVDQSHEFLYKIQLPLDRKEN